MKFFKFSDYIKSWSVWVLGALGGFATADFSGVVEAVVPDQYKPVVYAGFSFLGLLVRAIKQQGGK